MSYEINSTSSDVPKVVKYVRRFKCQTCPAPILESDLVITIGEKSYHTECWPGANKSSEQIFSCVTNELFQENG